MVSALIVLAVTNKELTRSCPAAHPNFSTRTNAAHADFIYDDFVTKSGDRMVCV